MIRRLPLLIIKSLSVYLLSAALTQGQTTPSQPDPAEPSLLQTIQRTASELEALPIDVILNNSSEAFSDWELRYDVTYPRFRLLYGMALAAELSSKEDVLECLAKIDDMSAKEKGLTLIALYVYHCNVSSPLNLDVIHEFYPDKDVPLGEPFDESQLALFIDLLNSYQYSQAVCVQKTKEADAESWEEDFRMQVRAFQTVAHYTDCVTGMLRGNPILHEKNIETSPLSPVPGDNKRRSIYELDKASVRFLYTLTLLESLHNEPMSYELRISFDDKSVMKDSIDEVKRLSPKRLLLHNLAESSRDVLSDSNYIESFYEVIIMREFLRTQFVYTRLNGFVLQGGRCGDSSPDCITLGAIATSLLNAINSERIESGANPETCDVPTQAPLVNEDFNTDEPFLEFLHNIAPEIKFFSFKQALLRPKRITAPRRPNIYVLKGESEHERCLDLTYNLYQPFFEFCHRFEQTSVEELNDALDHLEELSSKEKALLFIARTYYWLNNDTIFDRQSVPFHRLSEALNKSIVMEERKDVVFPESRQFFVLKKRNNPVESDLNAWRKTWNKNWRYDVWTFQYLLGDHNPFLNMGCTDEEILQFCTNVLPHVL